MNPAPLDGIRRSLDALVARERVLLAARAFGQAVASLAAGLLVGAVLLSLGITDLLGLAATATAVAFLVAIFVPAGKRWAPSGTHLRQARQVERLQPVLGHRLITVVGRWGLLAGAEPLAGRSTVLLERAASTSAARLAEVPPADVHPSVPSLRAGAVAVMALVVLALVELLLPVGPSGVLRVAMGDPVGEVLLESAAPAVGEEQAVVGDVVIRYVFPDYTGIEPVEVRNSDGTIHAPAGTRVELSARTADSFSTAALQVNDRGPVDARLVGGRDISAALVVDEPGVWRFLLFRDGGVIPSRDFVLEVEADSAPVVTLEREAPRAVPANRAIPLRWSVRDDFGVSRVVLEVTQDGETVEHELRSPLDVPRELDGALRKSPRELGIQLGKSAKLKIVAYDNDLAGGEKRGESTEFELRALGPQGQGRQMTRQYEALRDAMLPGLASFLVEDVPPTGGVRGVTRWTESARLRYDPIRELLVRRGPMGEGSIEADLVGEVMESGSRLIRFAITTWDPHTTRRVTVGDQQRFADLHGEAVVALEKAIYVIDSLLVSAAMAEVAEMAQELAAEAQDLASNAADMESAEILSRLDKLERTMARLAEKATRVDEGALQEYLNGRLDDTRNVMEEIRKAVAEGRLEDAREMLEQLAEQVQQMSEGINDRMAAGQSQEDQLGDAAQKAMDELQALEQEQRALAEELERKREELGSGFSEQLDSWNKLDTLAEEVAQRGRDAVEATGDGRGWRAESVRSLERLHERTGGIADAVRARDLGRSAERVRDARRPADMVIRGVRMEASRDRMQGEVPPGVQVSSEHVVRVRKVLDEMLELLIKLQEVQQSDDPELQQAAEGMAASQRELRERQQQLQKDLQRVERALPTGDGEASEAMQRAGEAMDRAGSSLESGEAMQGEGHQREAADRLGEARQQLQQQMEQMQQMQQARGQMQGQQQPGEGEGDGDQTGDTDDSMGFDIPAPEDFLPPEEYRKALLEGMAGDVPEEYRALKRQYFEELVKQ